MTKTNDAIHLSKPEMLRLMRSFSNQNLETVKHDVWKKIKAIATQSDNDSFVIEETSIGTSEYRWSTIIHPSVKHLIDYIFCQYADMITSTNMTTSTTTTTNSSESFAISNYGMTMSTHAVPSNIVSNEPKKEKKSMFNFDFGKITSDAVRVSMYGIAVKSIDGRYVSYDAKTHSVMDVEILNMPAGDFLYKMPVAIKDVKAGDVIIHNRAPMFVVETHESTMKVIDIREGTEKEIYLTKSPFGFNFATKVVSLMDMTGTKADESNPFGSMLPFMLMGDNKDFDPMMLMLMGNGKFDMGNGKFDMSNPMMMYFLMKDTNHKDLLPLLMMAKA